MTSCGWKGPVLAAGCASLPRASMSSLILSMASVKDVLRAEAEQDSRTWPPKRPPCDVLRGPRQRFFVRCSK